MKRIVALVLAALMLVSFVACAKEEKETIVVGYTIYEPMNYKDESGKLVGFDTELAETVFGNLGYTVIFQEIDWNAKYTDLDSGTIDCVWNGFTCNTADDDGIMRADKVDFSYNYMENRQVIVAKADAGISSAADLSGKIAAVEVATDATTHFGAQHIAATTGDDKKVTITVTRADEWSVGTTKPATDISSVINGKMSNGTTIDDANLVDGTSMFAGNTTLTTFVGDLGKLTTGTSMFSGCSGLVDFCADLGSLVDGTDMFKDCTLSEESIIYIVDSLPKVTSGTICLGTTVPEDLKDEAEDVKGWTVVVA